MGSCLEDGVFYRKSFWVEIIPILLFVSLSILFISAIFYEDNIPLIIGSFFVGISFLYVPIKCIRHFLSYSHIKIKDDTILVCSATKEMAFKVPEEISSIHYDERDIKIFLKNKKSRFVLLTKYLKDREKVFEYLEGLIEKKNGPRFRQFPLKTLMGKQREPETVNKKVAALVIIAVIIFFAALLILAY